jgi:hypothetical protein
MLKLSLFDVVIHEIIGSTDIKVRWGIASIQCDMQITKEGSYNLQYTVHKLYMNSMIAVSFFDIDAHHR